MLIDSQHSVYIAAHVDGVEYKDNVAYIESGSYSGVRTFELLDSKSSSTESPSKIFDKHRWRWFPYFITMATEQYFSWGAASPAAGSIFTSPTYARICQRYQDGQLTNQPLWPWPMNQRIKDAMVQSGRAPVDVTQTIERMFGPIPTECKTGNPNILQRCLHLGICT